MIISRQKSRGKDQGEITVLQRVASETIFTISRLRGKQQKLIETEEHRVNKTYRYYCFHYAEDGVHIIMAEKKKNRLFSFV